MWKKNRWKKSNSDNFAGVPSGQTMEKFKPFKYIRLLQYMYFQKPVSFTILKNIFLAKWYLYLVLDLSSFIFLYVNAPIDCNISPVYSRAAMRDWCLTPFSAKWDKNGWTTGKKWM